MLFSSYYSRVDQSWFYPVHLTPLNPYTVTPVNSLAVILALAGLWIITVAVFTWRKRFPFLFTGWLWYAGMLVPMSGIIQVGRQTHADRYTYLPQIGVFILFTWGALELLQSVGLRRNLVAVAAAVIVVGFGTISHSQTRYWKDSETLWNHALSVNPSNYVAHNNLANSIMARGDVGEAIGHFKTAIAVNPDYAEAHYNLGNALAEQKRYLEAIPEFQEAIRLRPGFYQARNNLACMFMAVGKNDAAISEFNAALSIRPDYVQSHLNLGQLLIRLGRSDEGQSHLTEAARLKTVQGHVKELSSAVTEPKP